MAKELYERIDRKVGDILSDIQVGRIGLPDLQRPFVWKDNKVRELLDSMINLNIAFTSLSLRQTSNIVPTK
jgi:uncharacterized protein with ParB-like and HNH nuclease domain